jgi:hypothetical protein
MMRVKGLSAGAAWQLLCQRAQRPPMRPLKLFLCVADHYEPLWARATAQTAMDRVERWRQEYPRATAGIADSAGRPPQHSFFYPAEEYRPELLEPVAEICRLGLGDVEVHLHHDNDTSDNLRQTLATFKRQLHDDHGLLRKDTRGQVTYGFIHGNWALDNARHDGRWCGVNDEITVLLETGCYADFTMPSAPAAAQTRTMNSIYYATDDPHRPNSHDRGVAARVGQKPPANSLLLVQGPLTLDWGSRKWGLLPRLENGEVDGHRPPNMRRFQLWQQAQVTVQGRPDWLFVKLHTHGAQERNSKMLLGEPMRKFHQDLAKHAATREGFEYFYVTAREMAGLVQQAEQGGKQPDIAAAANFMGETADVLRTQH